MRRVFLVANHPSLRDALTLAIHEQSDGALRVVGTARWQPNELAVIETARPDVVVFAVGIEGHRELQVLAHIRTLAPGARLVVLDTTGASDYWQPAALTYVDALFRPDELAADLGPLIRQLLLQRDVGSGIPDNPLSPPNVEE